MKKHTRSLLDEQQQIRWRRDFDALIVGFVLGVLMVLSAIAVFGGAK